MIRLIVVLLAVVATASAVSNDLAKAPNTQNITTLSSKDIDVGDQKLDQPILVAKKNNICLGKIHKGDIMLAKGTHIKKPCRNKVHVQDVTVKGQPDVAITSVVVTEVGAPQNSVATVREGGIGENYVVIRLQSAKGGGYHYMTEVWGGKIKGDIVIQG